LSDLQSLAVRDIVGNNLRLSYFEPSSEQAPPSTI